MWVAPPIDPANLDDFETARFRPRDFTSPSPRILYLIEDTKSDSDPTLRSGYSALAMLSASMRKELRNRLILPPTLAAKQPDEVSIHEVIRNSGATIFEPRPIRSLFRVRGTMSDPALGYAFVVFGYPIYIEEAAG
jgi:hypothetical protein